MPTISGGIRRTVWGLHRVRGKATGQPFGHGRASHRIMHVAHHRAGTVWMRKVLADVAHRFGLRLQVREGQFIRPWAEVVVHPWVPDGFDGAGDFRGSHLIRDPRDMVVSGYHYHLRTDEAWVREPRDEYGGRSYQEHLRDLDPHAGMMVEIERFAREEAPALRRWDYHQSRWLELTYESMRADEATGFAKLFDHYGFSESAKRRAVAIARAHSLEDPRGRAAASTHGRSGASGQWQDELSPAHKERFKELTGDLVTYLGYEDSADW